MQSLNRDVGPILIIEDSEADYEFCVYALQKAQIMNPIYWCKNGEDAINFLLNRGHYASPQQYPRPQLILLDLRMPRMNGHEVMGRIRLEESIKDIPVIVLTTSSDPKEIKKLYRLGANSFVTKPLELKKFVDLFSAIKLYWWDIVSLPRS